MERIAQCILLRRRDLVGAKGYAGLSKSEIRAAGQLYESGVVIGTPGFAEGALPHAGHLLAHPVGMRGFVRHPPAQRRGQTR